MSMAVAGGCSGARLLFIHQLDLRDVIVETGQFDDGTNSLWLFLSLRNYKL